MKKKLSTSQEYYALMRAQGYSQKDAALGAGYYHKGGYKLEKNPAVLARIAQIQQEIVDATIADARERQQFWTRAMRSQLDNTTNAERLRASELLGKAQGDFIERFMNIDLDGLSDEQLARVAAGENPVRVLAGDAGE